MNTILFLCLAVSAAPPDVPKPFKFTYGTNVSDKAKIYVETLFPKCDKDKWKIMTKEEFRRDFKKVVYHEYKVIKIVVENDEIIEIHFRLPRPDEYSAPDRRNEVASHATKP